MSSRIRLPKTVPKTRRSRLVSWNSKSRVSNLGAATEVTLFFDPGTRPDTYFKYGPTIDNRQPHWYEFLFNGETGAQILEDRIVLHLVDGGRGDGDLTENGQIADPGGPVSFQAQYFPPTPYLSTNDLPERFRSDCSTCEYFIEDFEDSTVNNMLEFSDGQIIGPGYDSGTPDVTDSVDADDGVVDGTGQSNERGHAYFSRGNSIEVRFAELVTAAGLVWTDGDQRLRTVTFESFDQDGNSLGVLDAGKLGDAVYTGTTNEDRFLGVRYGEGVSTGVSSIVISNVGGRGIEVDHIQFERNQRSPVFADLVNGVTKPITQA